jgi:hypothetical protein
MWLSYYERVRSDCAFEHCPQSYREDKLLFRRDGAHEVKASGCRSRAEHPLSFVAIRDHHFHSQRSNFHLCI